MKTSNSISPWRQAGAYIVDSEGGGVAKLVPAVPMEDGATTQKEWQANACLIAAAPELLAALKISIELGDMGPEGEAGKIARAAIAKARGE